MNDRFTPESKHVMDLARLESQARGHDHIGPEHVFLGLLAATDGFALTILRSQGLEADELRERVDPLVAASAARATGDLMFTERAKRVLESTLEEAQTARHTVIGTGHLLTALVVVPGTIPYRILTELGVSADAIRVRVGERGGWDRVPEPSVADTGRRVHILRDAVEILRAVGETETALAVDHAARRMI